MLTAYRRHRANCKHRSRRYKACFCPIWVQGVLDDKKIRRSLDLTSWEAAQKRIRDLEIHGEEKTISVEDACKRWIADCVARGLRDSTLRKYRERGRELAEVFRGVQVRSVSIDDLRELRESWKVKASSTGKRLEIIRNFFSFCVDSEWIEKNIAKQLKPPLVRDRGKLPFSKQQMEKIIWAVDAYREIYPTTAEITMKRLKAMVLLMRHSGLRISDVCALRRERIEHGKLLLRQAKLDKPVWLPLPKEVIAALKKCDEGDGFFFWHGTGKIKTTITEWQVRLKKLFTIAGVADGTGHRFRHTLAKDLLQNGVPLEVVAMVLGNTIRVVERHYAHWQESRQAQLEAVLQMARA
jgi:integrase